MLGSLIVHHMPTRSPSSSEMRFTKGMKARAAPRTVQPPLRANHSGLVTWCSVTIAVIASSRRAPSTPPYHLICPDPHTPSTAPPRAPPPHHHPQVSSLSSP